MKTVSLPWFLFCASVAGVSLLTGCVSSTETPPDAAVWSNPKIGSVGKNFPKVHGVFDAAPLSVTMPDLPEHTWVKVKFNLLVTGGWDGSNAAWGPDIFAMRVRGGEQLMMTTFSNIGAKTYCYVQAYPDDFPWALHYAFTGAKPVSGKPFRVPDPKTMLAMADACYPVEVRIPHTGGELTLDFMPVYDDPANDSQHWAISDFEWSAEKNPVVMDDVELEHLWSDLAKDDSVVANAAMWRLISGGEKAATFLIAKAKGEGESEPDQGNRPIGLRIHRLQKALRIMATPKTLAASQSLTYKIPEYMGGTPPVSN